MINKQQIEENRRQQKNAEFFYHYFFKEINKPHYKDVFLLGDFFTIVRAKRDNHDDLLDKVASIDINCYDNAIEFYYHNNSMPFRCYCVPEGTFWDTPEKLKEALALGYIKPLTLNKLFEDIERK